MTSSLHRAAPVLLVLVIALGAGLGVGSSLAQDAAPDITGEWKVQGWNPGSSREAPPDYTGVVVVEQASPVGSYRLHWKVGEGQQLGIAILNDAGALAASYISARKPGVVLYRPNETRTSFSGIWTIDASLAEPPGFEDWQR